MLPQGNHCGGSLPQRGEISRMLMLLLLSGNRPAPLPEALGGPQAPRGSYRLRFTRLLPGMKAGLCAPRIG